MPLLPVIAVTADDNVSCLQSHEQQRALKLQQRAAAAAEAAEEMAALKLSTERGAMEEASKAEAARQRALDVRCDIAFHVHIHVS